jgi:hypothetical protein
VHRAVVLVQEFLVILSICALAFILKRRHQILRNTRKALAGRNHGRLLIVDAVLPEGSDPHPAKLLDLVMLTIPGGRERTEPQWHQLCAKGGFKISRIVQTRVGKSVIGAFAAD